MIRLRPYQHYPWIRNGMFDRGGEDADAWWMRESVLNSNIIEVGDYYFCSVRADAREADEVGVAYDWTDTGPSIVRIRKDVTDLELMDVRNWEIINLEEPAFTPPDLTAYFDPTAEVPGSEWWPSQVALCADPNTVTNGHTRLILTYKCKCNDVFTPKAWSYSDDSGVTWTFGGFYVTSGTADTGDSTSNPHVQGNRHNFGQSVQWYRDGYWHMIATVGVTDSSIKPTYFRSSGANGDGSWTWDNETQFGRGEGATGEWDGSGRIGTAYFFETDPDGDEYLYVSLTGGNGKDGDEGSDPNTLVDITDGANCTEQGDYPNAIGWWRCPVDELTTVGSWEEYSRNPAAIRMAIGDTASGGIWNGASIMRSNGSRLFTFEAVGIARTDEVNDQQKLRIRDYQYGKGNSFLRLPKDAAYIVSTGISFYFNINFPDLGGCLVRKGVALSGARDPDVAPGSYYVEIHTDGSIEAIWQFQGTSGGEVRRSCRSAAGVISVDTDHEISVSFAPGGVNIYVDSNTPVATGPAAAPDDLDAVITFGTNGVSTRSMQAFITRLKVMQGEQDWTTIKAATGGSTDGDYTFASFTAGSPATSPDGSGTQAIEVRGPSYDGTLIDATKTGTVWLGGTGITYGVGGGSQQHWYIYDGPGFGAEWDDDPFPDGTKVLLQHMQSGKFLANDGGTAILSDVPTEWHVFWFKNFMTFNVTGTDGDDILTVNSRLEANPAITLESKVTATGSPFGDTDIERYDMQHWLACPHKGGLWTIQNRGTGGALNGYTVKPIRRVFEERWHIQKVE